MIRKFLQSEKGSLSLSESVALKAVSLLLALILWITILGFKKEEIERRVPLRPLLAPDVVITNEIPPYITFVISGPRVLLKKFERNLEAIQPDYRQVNEGVVGFAIREDRVGELPPGVRVISFSPSEVQLRLEKMIQKTLAVKPVVHGINGDFAVTVTPKRVTLQGPRSILESMDFVPTEPIQYDGPQGNAAKGVEVGLEVDKVQRVQVLSDRAVVVRVQPKK